MILNEINCYYIYLIWGASEAFYATESKTAQSGRIFTMIEHLIYIKSTEDNLGSVRLLCYLAKRYLDFVIFVRAMFYMWIG